MRRAGRQSASSQRGVDHRTRREVAGVQAIEPKRNRPELNSDGLSRSSYSRTDVSGAFQSLAIETNGS